MTDDLLRHLSVWPNAIESRPVLLSDPPVEADHAGDALIVGIDVLVIPEATTTGRLATLPDTFFWRELGDLDVSSLDKLAEFANCWGVPFVPRGTVMFDQEPGGVLVDRRRETFALPGEEARDAVRVLRNMVRVWQLVIGVISEEEYVEGWEPCDSQGQAHIVHLDVPPKAGVPLGGLSYLAPIVEHGIREFSPYIRVDARQPTATLFGATCAQLFNAIAQNRVWHRCARCGQPFLRKWSTERVQYCGPPCAKAAASKAYRDRKRDSAHAPLESAT